MASFARVGFLRKAWGHFLISTWMFCCSRMPWYTT